MESAKFTVKMNPETIVLVPVTELGSYTFHLPKVWSLMDPYGPFTICSAAEKCRAVYWRDLDAGEQGDWGLCGKCSDAGEALGVV